MIEIVWGFVVFLVRAVGATLDIAAFVADSNYLARLLTGADKLVQVPADPKPLPPVAQHALAEAEERQRARERAGQAASGTDQAS